MKIENISVPKILEVKEISGSCLRGVEAGGSCSIDLLVDVNNNAKPGDYKIKLDLLYIKNLQGAIVRLRNSISTKITIANPKEFLPKIEVITWYWGIERPITVFEHQRNVPLTLIIMNRGRYAIDGVILRIESMNSSVYIITKKQFCTSTLNPDSICRTTFYVDLANASKGIVLFKVYIQYVFEEFKTHLEYTDSIEIPLHIHRYAKGLGLEIIDSGWMNDWPVYPNSENVTYVVSFANYWPFRISGISIEIHLPKGFTYQGSPIARAYIPGPIDSLKTFSASFELTVNNVLPGRYKAWILVKYVVESGGSNILWIENHSIEILVHSLNNSIQFISSSWYGESPEPMTYGAILVITFRNNFVPQIKGAILELYLPKGFTCALNNKTYGVIPLSMSQELSISRSMYNIAMGRDSQKILRYITSMYGEETLQGVTPGQIMSFYVPLNVLVNKTGRYVAKAYLNFLDQWNNIRKIEFSIPIEVLGSSRLIEVNTSKSLKIVNGSASLEITLINRGSAPLYNIYVSVIPHSPIAIPVQNVKYIERLDPKSIRSLHFTFVYNPLSLSSGPGGMMIRYYTLPLSISIMYKDALGYQRVFNISAAVSIEPFIDIRLGSDTHAELRGSSLVISGTVLNYGLASARSVVVKALIGNKWISTLVGDIDPASQAAFRIEHRVTHTLNNVSIVVEYKDEYGRSHEQKYNLRVERIVLTETPTTELREGLMILQSNYTLIIVIIAIFLASVAY
ncbi:MAG TPA: hypothetical protein ENG44_01315, partial [Desulfurococcaceae archaeon]|nr:hypothetical protein [Desulfurococcaceae archaeon]